MNQFFFQIKSKSILPIICSFTQNQLTILEEALLTKSFICLDIATVSPNRIKHIQLQIPARLRRESQQKTCGSSKISPNCHQRSRPDPRQEPPPENRRQLLELLRWQCYIPRALFPVAGGLGHACQVEGIGFGCMKRVLYGHCSICLGKG